MNIVHNEGKGFYIYDENKEILARLEYKRDNNILTFDHTVVSDKLKGQGIAQKLLDEAVDYARKKLESIHKEHEENKKFTPSVIAFEMSDGKIITGKKSSLMDAPSAAILNSLKYLSNFDDELLLISPTILEPIIKLKETTLKNKNIPLDCEEILIALSITAATNSMAEVALSKLSKLEGVQAHSTHILGRNDEQSLRKLGIDVTSDQVFPTENLYYNQ